MTRSFSFVLGLLVALGIGCSGTESHGNREHAGEGRGEHAREGGHDRDGHEHGEHGAGEEDGTELALDATYDDTRHGARLVLAYDAPSNAFVGTVENTTAATLDAVRVEVHLSNGKELGPTPSADLAPGAKREVRLQAESTGFTGWSAHPEVGRSEHGHGEHGGEGRDEHGNEHGGEHGREGRGEHGGK